MSVRLRLRRMGKIHRPFYRICAIEKGRARTQAHPRHDSGCSRVYTHPQVPGRGNEVHRFAAFGLRAVEAVFTEPGHITNKATLQHEVNTEAGVGGCRSLEALRPYEIGIGNPSPSAHFPLQGGNLCAAPARVQK